MMCGMHVIIIIIIIIIINRILSFNITNRVFFCDKSLHGDHGIPISYNIIYILSRDQDCTGMCVYCTCLLYI